MLVDEKMLYLIDFVTLEWTVSSEHVSVLSSFRGFCDHARGSRGMPKDCWGKDGITRRNIYINAKG